MGAAPLLRDVLPDFHDWLTRGLTEDGHVELAAQMQSLAIYRLCGCDDDDCASFYCQPASARTELSFQSTPVYTADAEAIVDTDDGRIAYIELQGRHEARRVLEAAGISG